jgi:hypothetical protein
MFNHFMEHIPAGFQRPSSQDSSSSDNESLGTTSPSEDYVPQKKASVPPKKTSDDAVEMPSQHSESSAHDSKPPSMDLSASSGAFEDAEEDTSPPLSTASAVPVATVVTLTTTEDSNDSGALRLHPPPAEYMSDDDLLEVDSETVAIETRTDSDGEQSTATVNLTRATSTSYKEDPSTLWSHMLMTPDSSPSPLTAPLPTPLTTAQDPPSLKSSVKSVVVVPPSTAAAAAAGSGHGGARVKTYSTLAGRPAGAYPLESLDVFVHPETGKTFHPSNATVFPRVHLIFDPHFLFTLSDDQVRQYTAPEVYMPKARTITLKNAASWDEPRVMDKSPRPRFGCWVVMQNSERLYPVETNDQNMTKIFQYWNAKFIHLPTAWMDDRRIGSKLRNHPADRHVALMIAQRLKTTWAHQNEVPEIFRDFILSCQSGHQDFSQLYVGRCSKCNRTITNLVEHKCQKQR